MEHRHDCGETRSDYMYEEEESFPSRHDKRKIDKEKEKEEELR